MMGDHFGYSDGVKHGVSTYYLSVIPALLRRGASVEAWFLGDQHSAADELQALGVPVRFLRTGRWSVTPLLPLLRHLTSHAIDVAHVTNIRAIALARIAARLTGTPLLIHLHDAVLPPYPVRMLNRITASAGDMGVCVSSALRPLAESLYSLPRERIRILHNGLDLERFRAARRLSGEERRALLGIDHDGPVIGMVGRLHPVKGHQAMLSMMPQILARHARATLVIVGDGPIRAACEQHAARLGIAGQVRFLGQRQDLPILFGGMDVTVVPSLYEGLSLVAIESLASGTPVVAHDVGGVREVVTEGESGLLVPFGDASTFVAAVCRMLEDDSLRQRFSAFGQSDMERFALATHVDKLLTVYESCVGAGAKSRLPADP